MPEYKTSVSYRTVGSNRTAGNLSCGFLYKPDDKGSNRDIDALRKQFKASTGVSLGQYAIRVRVNRAKALLLYSDIPLEKLAVQLGYPDCFRSVSSSNSIRAYRLPYSGR